MKKNPEFFSRTKLLIGRAGLEKMTKARIAVIGLGGVGSYTVEALARVGVGYLRLVDHDRYVQSNLNRQLHALVETVGRLKSEVVSDRVTRINPEAVVDSRTEFLRTENMESIITEDLDYVIDAIDTVSSKVLLIEHCLKKKINIVTCMGAGNRLDPFAFRLSDLSKTHTCPLARAVRGQLRKKGIEKGVDTLFSVAPPVPCFHAYSHECGEKNSAPPGSISFVPSVAGLLLAGFVVNRLLESEGMEEKRSWGQAIKTEGDGGWTDE